MENHNAPVRTRAHARIKPDRQQRGEVRHEKQRIGEMKEDFPEQFETRQRHARDRR